MANGGTQLSHYWKLVTCTVPSRWLQRLVLDVRVTHVLVERIGARETTERERERMKQLRRHR